MSGSAIWPLFDLAVFTPRLELHYATDALLLELAGIAGDVIAPGTRPFEDGASFYDPTPAGRRRWLAGQWSARARTSADWWALVFAVIIDGRAVGAQEITGMNFPTTRAVETFSWLARSHQGKGIGREMRDAALTLAFEGLGAELARSEAFADNIASCSVSRALGYEEDAAFLTPRAGKATRKLRFVLARNVWLKRRRSDVRVSGLEPCLPLLGLAPKAD